VINKIKEYTYDQEADAIYITFSDKRVATTRALDDLRVIDYADDGAPVGIELLCVSEGVITDDLPHLKDVLHLLEGIQVKIFA
jgi:uncharacterized protein YuzE